MMAGGHRIRSWHDDRDLYGDSNRLTGAASLSDGLHPGPPALDAEVLVERGAMETLGDAIRSRPVDPGALVLDAFEPQEQFVGMAVPAVRPSWLAIGTPACGTLTPKPWRNPLGEAWRGRAPWRRLPSTAI